MPNAARPASSPGTLRRYFEESRDLVNSLVLVMPLFVAYQIGILGTGGVRNGVDFLTRWLIALSTWTARATLGGGEGAVLVVYLLFNVTALLLAMAAIYVLRERGTLRPKVFPWVLLESAVYAVLFGGVVTAMMRVTGLDVLLAIPPLSVGDGMSVFERLVMSVGAGFYEEVVFRLLLMSGLYAASVRVLGVRSVFAAILAVVTSSVIFSAVHYVGNMADAFTLGSFVYRAFAGVLLATIFQVRGFAVAVYTHAFYDILVLVLR